MCSRDAAVGQASQCASPHAAQSVGGTGEANSDAPARNDSEGSDTTRGGVVEQCPVDDRCCRVPDQRHVGVLLRLTCGHDVDAPAPRTDLGMVDMADSGGRYTVGHCSRGAESEPGKHCTQCRERNASPLCPHHRNLVADRCRTTQRACPDRVSPTPALRVGDEPGFASGRGG